MGIIDTLVPDAEAVAKSFIRTRPEWSAAIGCASGPDEVRDVVYQFELDSELRKTDRDILRKQAAKKMGVAVKSLEADIACDLPSNPDDGKKDDLAYARETIASFGLAGNLIFAQGEFWAWRDTGVWSPLDDVEVRQSAQRVLAGQTKVSAALVASVATLVKNELYRPGTRFDEPAGMRVNVANGTLEHIGGMWLLRDHCRDDYLTAQAPVRFDHAEVCPRFDAYLQEVFQGDPDAADKALVVREMLGYTLLQSCRYEKFIILVGGGSNGKSLLLNLLVELVGKAQCCAISPAKLDDRFQRGHIRGKLANVVPELPQGAVVADDKLKSFTSGDLINGEYKLGDPFDFAPYATFWTGTNHLPHTRDLSHGMARRAIILKFNRKFDGVDKDPTLLDKLKAELPGILVSALRAFSGVIARGGFTEPASSTAALREWMNASDQVAQFVDAECEKPGPGEPDDGITHAVLFERFRYWAIKQNIKCSVTGKTFSQRLHDLGYKSDTIGTSKKRERGFKGIRWAL